ncbi:VOC family protein [Streptomyces carpinensis]|uniref:VOC family protein n=1 Tax=Streptomyces carpinensis TaxID=66369 RepID=A0ABV1WBL1_9ACTN|nr:VOC family protein [Streptomyces carpinensis]
MLSTANIYHTGFVVPSIEDAMKEFTAVFGVSWTRTEEREMPVLTPDGPVLAQMRFAYSQGGEPRIELLEPVAGTIWEQPVQPGGGPSSAHHIGVWAEDFQKTSEELEAVGCPRVLTYDDGSGRAVRFAYHRMASGAIVEIIDATRRAELEAWFEGAAYPAAVEGD